MSTFSIDNLLAHIKPEPTFTVELPGSHIFTFRPIANADEEKKLLDDTRDLNQIIGEGKVPDTWKPHLIRDLRNLAYVVTLATLSVEPKLSQLDLLRLASEAPLYFSHLARQVDNYLRNADAIRQQEEVEEAKKGSPETSTSETDLSSPETSGAGTPTNSKAQSIGQQ